MRSLNQQVELVARLKRYKESQGIEFVDPQQEESVSRHRPGEPRPDPEDGLRDLYTGILELTKKEVR